MVACGYFPTAPCTAATNSNVQFTDRLAVVDDNVEAATYSITVRDKQRPPVQWLRNLKCRVSIEKEQLVCDAENISETLSTKSDFVTQIFSKVPKEQNTNGGKDEGIQCLILSELCREAVTQTMEGLFLQWQYDVKDEAIECCIGSEGNIDTASQTDKTVSVRRKRCMNDDGIPCIVGPQQNNGNQMQVSHSYLRAVPNLAESGVHYNQDFIFQLCSFALLLDLNANLERSTKEVGDLKSQVESLRLALEDHQNKASIRIHNLRETCSIRMMMDERRIRILNKQLREKEDVIEQSRWDLASSQAEVKQLRNELSVLKKSFSERDGSAMSKDEFKSTILTLQHRLTESNHRCSVHQDTIRRFEAENRHLKERMNEILEQKLRRYVDAKKQESAYAEAKEAWITRESALITQLGKERQIVASMMAKNDSVCSDIQETLHQLNSFQKFGEGAGKVNKTYAKTFNSLHEKTKTVLTKIMQTLQENHTKMLSDNAAQQIDTASTLDRKITSLKSETYKLPQLNLALDSEGIDEYYQQGTDKIKTVVWSSIRAATSSAGKLKAEKETLLAKLENMELLEEQYRRLSSENLNLKNRLCTERQKVTDLEEKVVVLTRKCDSMALSIAHSEEPAAGVESIVTLPCNEKENGKRRNPELRPPIFHEPIANTDQGKSTSATPRSSMGHEDRFLVGQTMVDSSLDDSNNNDVTCTTNKMLQWDSSAEPDSIDHKNSFKDHSSVSQPETVDVEVRGQIAMTKTQTDVGAEKEQKTQTSTYTYERLSDTSFKLIRLQTRESVTFPKSKLISTACSDARFTDGSAIISDERDGPKAASNDITQNDELKRCKQPLKCEKVLKEVQPRLCYPEKGSKRDRSKLPLDR
ncbi:unnamed protein product [Soboliphyme baturini]|uniref:Ig-like domain-containing protein n=1 Tax=Soboliphyme baturini TaxID=241478 RepID=A0A183IPQ8_9BILA|nr:unnamed protein product [Soboliphyme baturini]